MNILFVGAHHDDLELSVGGSVKRWAGEGHKIYSAILTTSTWKSPDGTRYRDPKKVEEFCRNAAGILDYTPISLNCCECCQLEYSDSKVVDILNIIKSHDIDMLITTWPYDAHKDHREASEIALAAARKIPRVLLAKISWNSTVQNFKPSYFVDINAQFDSKLKALQCYKDEYGRIGASWKEFIDSQSKLYGLEAGCKRAEGLEIVKYM